MSEATRRVRRKTGVGAAATLLLLVLFLIGCGNSDDSTVASSQKPLPGGTLRIADQSEVITLDPLMAVDNPSIRALSQIMEPLFRANSKGEVEPWLASEIKRSPDYLAWTLELRGGVVFANGKPLTADDVVFSLNEVRKSTNWASLFESIVSVSAKSPTSVVIKTSEPVASLEADLSLPAASIAPKNYGGMSPKEFGEAPIGTGPFKVASWEHGQALTLVKNSQYRKSGYPVLDKIVLESIADDNSRTAQLRSRQLDLVASPPWSQLGGLEETPGIHVGVFGLGLTDLLILNMREGLFADPRAREAIDIGIDRDDLVKAALLDNGQTAGSLLMPTLEFHDSSIEPSPHDPAKAKELVAEAAKATGEAPSLTLTYFAGDTYYNTVAQIIQANLDEIGFEVSLQPLDESAAISRVVSGDFDMAIFYGSSDIVDPSELVGLYVGSEGFFSGADTAQVEKLAQSALSELDKGKREELYYEIQRLMARQRGALAYDYRPFVWAMQDTVVGFNLNPTGIPWLAETGFTG